MLNFLLYPTKERKNMSKHLTQEQRYHIEAYKKAGFGNSEIARDLGVHPSTIGRELKRNSSSVRHKYSAKVAQEISSLRKSVNSKANKKFKNELKDLVILKTEPPLAVPSSLVMMIPSIPIISSKAFA